VARESARCHADHGPSGDHDPTDPNGTTREASYGRVSSGASSRPPLIFAIKSRGGAAGTDVGDDPAGIRSREATDMETTDRVGFEPTIPLRVYRFSRPAPSATRTPVLQQLNRFRAGSLPPRVQVFQEASASSEVSASNPPPDPRPDCSGRGRGRPPRGRSRRGRWPDCHGHRC